jgi:putative phosphoesterase
MIVGLISDTHGKLRPAIFELFRGVDLILHAGDVGPLDIITALETIAPVHAVLGNTDSWELIPQLQEVVDLELEGRRVVVMHGHQLGSPTPRLLRVAHPRADVIVYGHTHRQHVDQNGGTLVVNPGAAGPARFSLKPSVAKLTLDAGSAPAVELLPIEE